MQRINSARGTNGRARSIATLNGPLGRIGGTANARGIINVRLRTIFSQVGRIKVTLQWGVQDVQKKTFRAARYLGLHDGEGEKKSVNGIQRGL